ncbi:MAG TPA: hypothetical protein VM715_16945, partial [Candidatus Acidoferrum sp.]|nr:hypothetical protein [Candidatus Acidoferrum sp.]
IGSLSISGNPASLPAIPPNLREEVFRVYQLTLARKSQDLNNAIASARDVHELKDAIYSYLGKLTFLDPSYRRDLYERIGKIGVFEGREVHPFVLAIGEIQNSNPLALGSLVVALAIDLLVLFCGFLGARPDSYLTRLRLRPTRCRHSFCFGYRPEGLRLSVGSR